MSHRNSNTGAVYAAYRRGQLGWLLIALFPWMLCCQNHNLLVTDDDTALTQLVCRGFRPSGLRAESCWQGHQLVPA